jgi:hypothetical protein
LIRTAAQPHGIGFEQRHGQLVTPQPAPTRRALFATLALTAVLLIAAVLLGAAAQADPANVSNNATLIRFTNKVTFGMPQPQHVHSKRVDNNTRQVVFTSLTDALHAGYEVVSSTQNGYLVRLLQADGSESYGIVELLPQS